MNLDDELEAIKHKKQRSCKKRLHKAMMSSITEPIVLTDSNLQARLQKYPIMLVDFWAPWCGPCKMVSPIIEQLSREYSGRVAFGKVNVDENQRIAASFGIRAFPPDDIQGRQGGRRNHGRYAKSTDRDEAKTTTIVKERFNLRIVSRKEKRFALSLSLSAGMKATLIPNSP